MFVSEMRAAPSISMTKAMKPITIMAESHHWCNSTLAKQLPASKIKMITDRKIRKAGTVALASIPDSKKIKTGTAVAIRAPPLPVTPVNGAK